MDTSTNNAALSFFPFRTRSTSPLVPFDDEQVVYACAYPSALAQMFACIKKLVIHETACLVASYQPPEDDDPTKEIVGFWNPSLERLQEEIRTKADFPKEGCGITGCINVAVDGASTVRMQIFQIETMESRFDQEYEIEVEDICHTLVGAIQHDIISNSGIADYIKTDTYVEGESILLPKSLVSTPRSFLAYLLLRGDTLIDATGRKPNYHRKLEYIRQGFQASNDCLVLQMAYVDFLKDIEDWTPYRDAIRRIDRLILGKTAEYDEIFGNIHN
jgi:hypothetical protein